MYAWQIYYQRNRRRLIRAAALASVGLAALLLLVPMPGAVGTHPAEPASGLATLMSPHPLATRAFVSAYLHEFG